MLMQLVGVDFDFFGHAIPPRPRGLRYNVASAASSAAIISCSRPPKK